MRIVYLDDQEDFSILLQKIIKPEIYCYYSDIDACMHDIKAGDIVLLDFILGNDIRNGFDVAKKLREEFGNTIRIIFYSSFLFMGSDKFYQIKEISDGIINKSDFSTLKTFLNGVN